ncbi:MAG: hypothetical protein CFH01_00962 [Alphaproteobacteria bacterium MarineAlpha2_Bin1]|nr:MAG: hypothetical protein CFH01_00962 [Alphaproteobacteria bacterium MarineAlpha2_Bin1]
MKIASFITARLKSQRLKRKVLLPICGRPMLSHLIDRLKLSKKCQQIVLCTSTIKEDDDLENFAIREGVDCFRGHPDDVMLRLRDAADFYKTDIISSCTADNPLIDNLSMDDLIDYHINGKFDFSISKNIPFGTFTMTVNSSSLDKACDIKDSAETEFWPQYFLRTNQFKLGELVHNKIYSNSDIRLTVDEKPDFELMNIIFSNLHKSNKIFSLEDVIKFLDKNPELKKINSNVKQKIPSEIKLKRNLAA